MSLILAYKSLGIKKNVVLKDADDTTVVLAANDIVRVKIGRKGETPKLSFTSSAPTSNGSSFTKGSTGVLRLDASDLAFIDPGVYSLFLEYWDASDEGGEWKEIDREVFVLEE